MKKTLLKIALLSVSTLVASAPAINANIPAMAAAFPDIPLSQIELVTTIPSLFLMISVLTSSFIAKKFGYKQTITLGLIIVAISGITPVFVNNFYVVLVSRALLGLGIGLFNSLLISLISYFFDGKERATLIGYHEAIGGLGGMMITLIAGRLMNISWQAPFIAYAIAFPVIAIFVLVVPNVTINQITPKKEETTVTTSNGSMHFVFAFMAFIFIGATLNMTMGIKVSTLMVELGYGTTSDASLVITLLSFGAMISGFLFGKVYAKINNYILPIGFVVVALAMFLIGISNSVLLTVFGGFLTGFGFRVMMPALTNVVNNSSISNKVFAVSLLIVAYNLGSALAPYTSLYIQNLSWTTDLRGVFYIDGLGFIVLALIAFITIQIRNKASIKTNK